MATITIADEHVAELAAALSYGLPPGTIPEGATDIQIVRARTKEILTGVVRRYRVRVAQEAARATAEAGAPTI